MIIAAIEAHLETLRPSEQAVARFVLGRPSVVVHMSIADIAESCEVSEPTIMRFCKALGCLGFMEFKLALARDLERRTFSMSRENPAVKGPKMFGQAIFARVIDELGRCQFDFDRLDEVLDFIGASRAVTIVHDGSEAASAHALVESLLVCRLEARVQTGFELQGRGDGQVILALRSAALSALFETFCLTQTRAAAKVVVVGADYGRPSVSLSAREPTDSDHVASLPDLKYLVLIETLRQAIIARLSRAGPFSDTATDMLQAQREIAYGDARRRDRQLAEVQDAQSQHIQLQTGETV
jgi:RpiR family transcriptional regulator, carbohydrate utilization regulator